MRVFFAPSIPFQSKEVGKVEGEAVALLRIERPDVAVQGKLDSGFDADGAIDVEETRAEKDLVGTAARQLDPLPLQCPGVLPSQFPKDALIPARVIGAPGEGSITVNRRVGEQIGAAIAF
jgi:hypothetical protein